MINKNTVTLGADPEVFLLDSEGTPVPALDTVGGTKEEPRELTSLGHAVQEDNVLIEFNIPPTVDGQSMAREIKTAMDEITKIIPEGHSLGVITSHMFEKAQLVDPRALEFGCDPDYNVYTLDYNERPNCASLLRTGGGHIHVGIEDLSEEDMISLIKAMDLFLGVPSVLADKDTDRRSLYGKAGAFRIKPYGCEYRTLSNFWISSEENINWAYEATMKAIDFVNEGKQLGEDEQTIVDTINSSNVELAEQLVKKYELNIPELVKTEILV